MGKDGQTREIEQSQVVCECYSRTRMRGMKVIERWSLFILTAYHQPIGKFTDEFHRVWT